MIASQRLFRYGYRPRNEPFVLAVVPKLPVHRCENIQDGLQARRISAKGLFCDGEAPLEQSFGIRIAMLALMDLYEFVQDPRLRLVMEPGAFSTMARARL